MSRITICSVWHLDWPRRGLSSLIPFSSDSLTGLSSFLVSVFFQICAQLVSVSSSLSFIQVVRESVLLVLRCRQLLRCLYHLGCTLNWGIFVSYSAMTGNCDWPICLAAYFTCVCWSLIYDTIYGYQVRSTWIFSSFSMLLAVWDLCFGYVVVWELYCPRFWSLGFWSLFGISPLSPGQRFCNCRIFTCIAIQNRMKYIDSLIYLSHFDSIITRSLSSDFYTLYHISLYFLIQTTHVCPGVMSFVKVLNFRV